MARNRKTLKYWGIGVQVLTYVANGVLWCLALYSTGFGIVIGLSSGTIATEGGKLLDWIVLTPATIFLVYGVPLLAIATFGCFATVSANYIAVIIYALLVTLYLIYDATFGISLIVGEGAYDKFISSLKESQLGYSKDNPSGIGVIPIHPRVYWDHIQRRGKCCGLYSYEDWKDTSMAKQSFSIPDSCCNELYDYDGCGTLVWKHPDHEGHTIESIIFNKGCLTIFPSFIQSDEDGSIGHLGRFLIAMLFIALITAIVLVVLVLTRMFRTSTGINNPDFIDVPADPSLLIGREVKVHPAPDVNANDDGHTSRDRKISFDDKGPTLIPERQQTPQQRHDEAHNQETLHERRNRTSPAAEQEFSQRSNKNRRER